MSSQELILSGLPDIQPVRRMLSLSTIVPKFRLHVPGGSARAEVEAYISGKFRRSYGAQIEKYMPYLLTVSCGDSYSAALGIRNAGSGRLYLESYLEDSIESVLTQRLSADVRRDRLVEIGNLVSTWRGSSQLLFLFLTLLLEKIGCEWVAFTATEEVAQLIRKMNFKAVTLCEARREQVGGDAGKWGSYYETRPHVMAGPVAEACAVIRRHPLSATLAKTLAPQVGQISELLGEQS